MVLLLAQVRTGIPAEVRGWFEAAKAASAKGDSAEALRLQKQVMVWVQANRPALDRFRVRALFNLGRYLSERELQQEAMAPTEEAVNSLRQLEGSQPETQRFLARALTNLGDRSSNLGRRQEALAATEEAGIRRALAKSNPASPADLANAWTPRVPVPGSKGVEIIKERDPAN